MDLVLIRGLPGSGKTTLAQKNYPNHAHFEADQYFMEDGKYCFDRNKLAQAHAECLSKTKSVLESGRNVVVSNTFVKNWEMQKYLGLGFQTVIITATGNYQNVHGVPLGVIERMRDNWER